MDAGMDAGMQNIPIDGGFNVVAAMD